MSHGSSDSRLDRRAWLQLLAAGAAGAALPGVALAAGKPAKGPPMTMPALFAAHGNPMFMDDALFMRELADWAKALPKPKAVLMISAHWEEKPLSIGATKTVPLYYDFSGFPQRYYEVKYPAPGAPWLAERVRELMRAAGLRTAEEPERGLDHGAYVPMVCMYPKADVPVLQVSLPSLSAQENFEVGRVLAPLRQEGVLIVGAGFLTHNLRLVDWRPDAPAPAWAKEFDGWAEAAITRRDFDTLIDFRNKAPAVRTALPTVEHYVPLLVAAGASSSAAEPVTFPITGFAFGSFTKRSVQFG
jgi:4,5-DOPA dioxygenase extradiol